MAGRVALSGYESIRAMGQNVVCLSPVCFLSCMFAEKSYLTNGLVQWGDSSPILLPCIRWRDVVIHTIAAASVLYLSLVRD